MELPSTYQFQGWDIRYSIQKSDSISESDKRKTKCVVFVHGTPWSSAVFRPIIEALLVKGQYHILVYDLPGYGQSQNLHSSSNATTSEGKFIGDTSVKFQALALTNLLQHTQLDGKNGHSIPAILAHDIAGAVVLRAHLIHGCEFDTMMLVDTNAVLPWGDGFYKLARSNPQIFMELPPGIFEAVVRAVTQSALHNPKILEAGWGDIIAQPWLDRFSNNENSNTQDRQRSFVRQIAQANDQDVAEMLKENIYERVRCDVKVVWGEKDQWIPREKMEELIKRIGPRVKERAFIPNAGHLVMLDQPERFAIEVFDWLVRYGSHYRSSSS